MEVALKLLAVRARASGELERTLLQRGFSPEERADALSRLRSFGYLDDDRFAQQRVETLLRDGRGERAVLAQLERHGVSAERAQAALEKGVSAFGFDPQAAARALLAKRGLLDAKAPKACARAVRLLAARGFADEVIAACLPASALDPLGQDD
jgi:regulatory protein